MSISAKKHSFDATAVKTMDTAILAAIPDASSSLKAYIYAWAEENKITASALSADNIKTAQAAYKKSNMMWWLGGGLGGALLLGGLGYGFYLYKKNDS